MKTGPFVLLGVIALFFACSQNRLQGTLDESDTGITGMVRNMDLSAAKNANVKLFVAGDTSKTSLQSMTTDGNGGYAFTNLSPGMYNVWADGADSSVAFVDSINVPAHQEVPANATLGRPGSVAGIVVVQPGHSPQSVTVQALGTNKFTNVDRSGRFALRSLAQGDYTLRCVSTIAGYTPTYREITVTSSVDDTLADTIFMVYTGIPPVSGITAVYDPYTGIAKLSWNKMRYDNLYQYRIYRDAPDALQPSTSPYKVSTDTLLYDTIFTSQSGDMTASLSFRYRVTIFNKSYQEGLPFEFADIDAVNPVKLVVMKSPTNGQHLQTSDGVKLQWAGVPGATQYHILLASDSAFTDTAFQATTGDTAVVTPVLKSGAYFMKIQAKSPAGTWGEYSLPTVFSVNLFYASFGVKNYHQVVENMLQTSDKGYLITGETYPVGNPNDFDVLLIKTDSMGRELWRQTYAENGSQTIKDIKSLTDGYLMVGTSISSSGNASIFALKVDLAGTQQWMKTVSDSEYESATSLDLLPSGMMLIGATNLYRMPTDPIDNLTRQRSKLLIVNSEGTTQSIVILDSAGKDQCVIGKDASSYVSFTINMPSDGGLFQTDTITVSARSYSGELLWSNKKALDAGQFSIISALQNAKGELIVSGASFLSGTTFRSLMKFSANGTFLSTVGLGYPSGGPGSLKLSPTGEYVCARC